MNDWWNGGQCLGLRNARSLSCDLCHAILDEMRNNGIKYQKIHAYLVSVRTTLLLVSKLRFIINTSDTESFWQWILYTEDMKSPICMFSLPNWARRILLHYKENTK